MVLGSSLTQLPILKERKRPAFGSLKTTGSCLQTGLEELGATHTNWHQPSPKPTFGPSRSYLHKPLEFTSTASRQCNSPKDARFQPARTVLFEVRRQFIRWYAQEIFGV